VGRDEDALVGANQQPEWTTHRRFTTSRIYVQQPPGEWGVEQWWRMDDSSDVTPRNRFRTEVEYGLAKRTQVDLYIDSERTREADYVYNALSLEFRYALADWGKLLLNPTLYYEYLFVDEDRGPNKHEIKLLLGDAVGSWHYGVNLIYEQELGSPRETEYAVSQALSYTVRDSVWSIGEEFKWATVSEEGLRDEASDEYSAGPSIQIRPTSKTHLDLVALVGLSDDAADIETFVVFGYDFGGPRKEAGINPASSKME
jgi:hypothetical protein